MKRKKIMILLGILCILFFTYLFFLKAVNSRYNLMEDRFESLLFEYRASEQERFTFENDFYEKYTAIENKVLAKDEQLEDMQDYLNNLLISHGQLQETVEEQGWLMQSLENASMHFYLSKLSDQEFFTYYNHNYIWHTAPEALGSIGKPAIPYLIDRLDTEDPFELEMIFYALLLASQDKEVDAFTGGEYINVDAFSDSEKENNIKIIMQWWDKYKENF